MPKVLLALGGAEARDALADRLPDGLHGPTAGGPQDRLQLRETQFDRIEIGTVLRQKPEVRAHGFERVPNGGALVAREIVEDHDIAGAQGGHKDLLDPRREAGGIDRPVKHAGRHQALHAEAGEKRRGVPAAIGRGIRDARTAAASPIPPDQVRADAALIQKHQAGRIQRRGLGPPGGPRRGDVRAILLGRAHRFF